MKTYKDNKYNLEISIPDEWELYRERIPIIPSLLFWMVNGSDPNVDISFVNGKDEIVNIIIEEMNPEPSPEDCVMMFNYAVRHNTEGPINFGLIAIAGRYHACVSYLFLGKIWSKKYMIVLNRMGYAITAGCTDFEYFKKREPIWDEVAKSIRLL
jgi:hypothetical protein